MNTNPRGSMPAILLLRSRKTLPPACHAFLTTVVLLLALPLIPAASAQSRRIELNDFSKIVSVSDPQISPDGRTIVVAVSRPNLEQDRSDRELVSIDIATGTQRILTYERKGVGSPRWSPSGDRLAFVATDGAGKDAKPQVFVLPMTGGEARKITEAPNGIEQFAWRPNGQDIAYVTSEEPANKKEIEKHHDAFEAGDNDFLATEAALPSHIWLLPVDGGKAVQVTGPSAREGCGLAVTAEGLYYIPPPDSRSQHAIQFVSFSDGKSRPVVTSERSFSMSLSVSPDQRFILYSQTDHSGSDLMLIESFQVR